MLKPGLYLVPTPIGNLEDITLRALNVLKEADIIACEDTRNSGQLLKLLEIKPKKLISYHNYNEAEKSDELINLIKNGKSVALISDAGSPLISDPGFKIVNLCIQNEITIVPLPGATAFVPALSASGMPVNSFTFLGFPPAKKGRQTFLKFLENIRHTVVLYESPHKIIKLLEELIEIYGKNIQICIAREISKIYEEFTRGEIESVLNTYQKKSSIKGEIVVIIDMDRK